MWKKKQCVIPSKQDNSVPSLNIILLDKKSTCYFPFMSITISKWNVKLILTFINLTYHCP